MGTLYGVRAELIASLGTKDPREAKRLAPDAEKSLQAKLDVVEATARGEAPALSDKQVAALAGELFYRQSMADIEENPGRSEDWDRTLDALRD